MFSPYRFMCIFINYDLPTYTDKQRKAARVFCKNLKNIGFHKRLNSTYLFPAISRQRIPSIKKMIEKILS